MEKHGVIPLQGESRHVGHFGRDAERVTALVADIVNREEDIVRFHEVARGGDVLWILFLYATHCLNNSVHNLAWFVICELEGGVSTGLLMGVKAALLFFASAVFFCDSTHPEQCLTPSKGIATVVVLLGTTIYYAPEEKLPRLPRAC